MWGGDVGVLETSIKRGMYFDEGRLSTFPLVLYTDVSNPTGDSGFSHHSKLSTIDRPIEITRARKRFMIACIRITFSRSKLLRTVTVHTLLGVSRAYVKRP